jgi:hypothetical protein
VCDGEVLQGNWVWGGSQGWMVIGHQQCVCWESVGMLGVEILVLVEGDLRGLWVVNFSVGVLGVWGKE